jgi:hypothetical protein
MPAPTFANIGKKAKDLFGKQYDYKNSLTIKKNSKPLSVESEVLVPSAARCKVTYKHEHATVETTFFTKGDIALGVTGNVADTEIKLKNPHSNAKVEFTSTNPALAGATLTGSADLDKNLEFAAVLNVASGTVAGANVKYNGESITDYGIAGEYSTKDLILSFKTKNSLSAYSGAWWQKFQGGVVGVEVACSSKDNKTVNVGCEYPLADDTSLKAKMTHAGLLETSVTHTFSTGKVQIAGGFDLLGSDVIAPTKLGIGFTFGDF